MNNSMDHNTFHGIFILESIDTINTNSFYRIEPGVKKMKAGRTWSGLGIGSFFGGVMLLKAGLDKNAQFYSGSSQGYDEMSAGLSLMQGGIGMYVAGRILLNRGRRDFEGYRRLQRKSTDPYFSIKTSGTSLSIYYKF